MIVVKDKMSAPYSYDLRVKAIEIYINVGVPCF
jgi:hypothetical protein